MKNLQNFGVQELGAEQIKETNGGWMSTFKPSLYLGILHAASDFIDGAVNRFNKYR